MFVDCTKREGEVKHAVCKLVRQDAAHVFALNTLNLP